MASIVSINVGRPRTIMWRGRPVETAIAKKPIIGRVAVRKTNIDGDAQADLVGHGGEQRAVFVYQQESYRHWEAHLGRDPFTKGTFGENLTVEGLPDDAVCIGDRYRAGSVLFEVSQPRVTCFKVGIVLKCREMPALLVAHHRPGFYFRVIEEGEIDAGDEIDKVFADPAGLTVAATDALLYSSDHDQATLRRALGIAALSPGWQKSFRALLAAAEKGVTAGNAGLAAPRAPLAWAGYRPLKVVSSKLESSDIRSFELADPTGRDLPETLPGQYVGIRVRRQPGPRVARSYSLCGAPGGPAYRIAVKNERGAASGFLHEHVRPGDLIDVGAPRGSFILTRRDLPVVLLSAGVGVTPLLAMLYAAAQGPAIDPQPLWWVHSTRDGESHAFAEEAGQLVARLPLARSVVFYSRPAARDRLGVDFDIEGRTEIALLAKMGLPSDADFFMCGPQGYLDALRSGLQQWGVPPGRIKGEVFGPKRSPNATPPHAPDGPAGSGPGVTFTRSGLRVSWSDSYGSLLELAEACSVQVDWSCRTGVCHRCESGLAAGEVTYDPVPLDPPPEGSMLLCCAVPKTEIEVEL